MDKKGRTALYYAVNMGDFEKARLLLESNPSSAFICDENGDYPIHRAVLGGHTKVIILLASSKCLLNAKGQNIIHVAVLTGNHNIVINLLDSMLEIDSLINQKDDDGNTPLHLATLTKHVRVVELLLQDVRVKVGVRNNERLTGNDLAKKLIIDNKDIDVLQRLNAIFERDNNGFKRVSIDGYLLWLLFQGDIDQFHQILSGKRIQLKDLQCLEGGSNILHIAASMDNDLLNKVINLLKSESNSNIFEVFMEQENNLGDLPIHAATHAGKLGSLNALFVMSSILAYNLCLRPNVKGNTPLHIAVLNHHKDIANYLYKKCPKAAYSLNKDNICPLFLVINYWSECNLVIEMINGLDEQTINHLMGAKSVIHAAILTRKIAILKLVVKKATTLLLDSHDSNGRNPLSYAAHIGYAKGVRILLDEFPELEFKRDKDENGSFPIHQATKGGQLEIIKLLHPENCLVNSKRQNILHVAAETGRVKVVRYLLKRKEFKELLNTGDEDGNTPLHLAIKGSCYKVVNLLTWEKDTNSGALNNKLLTARDMFQQKEVILLMLRHVKGQQSIVSKNGGIQRNEDKETEKEHENVNDKVGVPSYMHITNALLVVAALVITATFAAQFTPPGGYDAMGKPILIRTASFNIFIISNFFAFTFAVGSAISLIFGTIIPKLSRVTLFYGGVFMCLGLIAMSASFLVWSLVPDVFYVFIVFLFAMPATEYLVYLLGKSTWLLTRMYISLWFYTLPLPPDTHLDFTI